MMFRGPKFLGYFGIFPLTAVSFVSLRSGQLAEEDISSDDIASDSESKACTTWYFSGYALYEKLLFSTLVSEAFRRWASCLSDSITIEAVSFAVGGTDEKVLEELGFRRLSINRRESELPIVYRTFDKEQVLRMADSIERQNQQQGLKNNKEK